MPTQADGFREEALTNSAALLSCYINRTTVPLPGSVRRPSRAK